MGNSRPFFGINANQLEQNLNKKGYDLDVINLAYPHASLIESLYYLQSYLKANPKPSLIIHNIVPLINKKEFPQTYLYRCRFSHSFNLYCLSHSIYLIRYRHIVNSLFKTPKQFQFRTPLYFNKKVLFKPDQSLIEHLKDYPSKYNPAFNFSAHFSPQGSALYEAPIKSNFRPLKKKLRSNAQFINKNKITSLTEPFDPLFLFASYSKEIGIPVFFIKMPYLIKKHTFISRIASLLFQLNQPLYYLDTTQHFHYPASHFFRPGHLNALGSKAFTQDLSTLIEDYFSDYLLIN